MSNESGLLRRMAIAAALAVGLPAAVAIPLGPAEAGWKHGHGHYYGGVFIGGPIVYAAPAPVYYLPPPPVYYAPPPPPPVVYAPPPVYYPPSTFSLGITFPIR